MSRSSWAKSIGRGELHSARQHDIIPQQRPQKLDAVSRASLDPEQGHEVGHQVFHDLLVGAVGIALPAGEHVFDKNHVPFAERTHLGIGRLVVFQSGDAEDVGQPEQVRRAPDTDDGGVGGQVAEALAFAGGFDEHGPDDAERKQGVHQMQHGTQHHVAPFGVFAVETHDFDAHRHFAGRLADVPDFEKNMVEKKAEEREQEDRRIADVSRKNAAEKEVQKLQEHEIGQQDKHQVHEPRQCTLAQTRQFVLDGDVLGGGDLDGFHSGCGLVQPQKSGI